MMTSNDKLYIILHSCDGGVEASRLPYYVYIYQLLKVDFNFKFKVTSNGFTSPALDSYINELISGGYLEIIDGGFKQSERGEELYLQMPITNYDFSFVDYIASVLNLLGEQELYFLCVTHMVVDDVFKKYSYEELASKKAYVENLVSSLTGNFTEKEFNSAVSLIRRIWKHEG